MIFPEEGKHYITIWMRAASAKRRALHRGAPRGERDGLVQLEDLPAPLFLPLQNLLDGKSLPGRRAVL